MRDFNRDNKFGGGNRFGRGGGRPSVMHKAICSECGNACEVPFVPSGDKPVFCSRCFEKNGNASPRRSGGRDFGGRPSFEKKQMFSVVCDGCGNNCEVPFRPTGAKPIYCAQCFNRGDNVGKNPINTNKTPDQYKQQLEILNIKLDRILNLLSPKTPAKEEIIVKAKKEPKAKKPAKKVAVKKPTTKKKK